MLKKRIKSLSVILIGSVSLVGCSSALAEAGKARLQNKTDTTIPVILSSTSYEYWDKLLLGAREAAKDLGVKIKVQSPEKETDIALQVQMVEEAITQKAPAIVLVPCDAKRLVPVAVKAEHAGIPVVTVDSGVDSDKLVSYIATNNEDAGVLAAKYMANSLGRKGKVAIVSFSSGKTAAIDREKGFKEEMEKYPDIKVINTYYSSDGEKDKAELITKDILTTQPDISGIFDTNESSAVGSAIAVKLKGNQDKIVLVGFDSSLDEIKLLQEGVLKGVIVQNPYKMGYLSVKNAVEAIKGEIPEKQIYTDATLITKENMNTPENQMLLYPFEQ